MKLKIRIRRCTLAEYENSKSQRQYLHVGHISGCICKAIAFDKIPANHQLALLLHELGHLAIEGDHSEEEANEMVKRIFGVSLKYVPKTPWGARLQFISSEDLRKVYKILKVFVDQTSLKFYQPSPLLS